MRPAANPAGFYQRIVMQSLEQMTLGCLQLELPDGTKIIIGQPDAKISASVRVLNWDFFRRCVLFGDIGFGEAFVDGDWDTDDITSVISWFILNVENSPAMSGSRGKHFFSTCSGGRTASAICSARTAWIPAAATLPSITIWATIFTNCSSIRR